MSTIYELTDSYIAKLAEIHSLADYYLNYSLNLHFRGDDGYPNFESEEQMNEFFENAKSAYKEIDKYINVYSNASVYIRDGELATDPKGIASHLSYLITNFWKVLLDGSFRLFDNDPGYKNFGVLLSHLGSLGSQMLDTLFE